MATRYAQQQQSVMDGSSVPPAAGNGGEINANRTALVASKLAGTDAWNSGDVVYLGRKPAGKKITNILWNADTSMGSATVSIGIGTDPRVAATVSSATYYTAAKTVTATDTPTTLGPKASVVDDAAPDEQHLWATIGGANIAAAVIASIVVEMVGVN